MSESGSVFPKSGLPVQTGVPTPEARLGKPDEEDRYEAGGLLGRGGMGEVRIARDPRLGRDVAMKTWKPEDPDGARRLAQEASLTAKLEHPNIVPVYSAGRDPEGTPYYTMRVLRGQTLSRAIAEATDTAHRLRLVRHVLVAAEAIAYAHGRGVLHRDLKPANIMVGTFGETVVTDWGLACNLDGQEEPGGGTSGFASPEQMRGERVDGRADVFGLGATLYAILVGESPPIGPPPVRKIAKDVPVELAAIADRALKWNPDDRYPTAQALADDLLAWYEGRRVTAHLYTPWELMGRLWASWRIPIAVGMLGALALTVAVSIGWWKTAEERARAQSSEAVAISARAAEGSALASALLAQALTAAREEHPMEAEILAASALVRQESPKARGVLAQFGGRPRMGLLRHSPTPPCGPMQLSPDATRMLCVTENELTVRSVVDPSQILAQTTGSWQAVSFTGDETHAVVVDGDGQVFLWRFPEPPTPLNRKVGMLRFGDTKVSGIVSLVTHGGTLLIHAPSGEAEQWKGCGQTGSDQGTAIASDGSVFTSCVDRRIVHGPVGEPGTLVTTLGERDVPLNLTIGDAGELVVNTIRGAVLVLDAVSGVTRERYTGVGDIRSVAIQKDKIAASFTDGNVRVWARSNGVMVGSLRAPFADLNWMDEAGSVLRILSGSVEDRSVSLPRFPHRIPTPAG